VRGARDRDTSVERGTACAQTAGLFNTPCSRVATIAQLVCQHVGPLHLPQRARHRYDTCMWTNERGNDFTIKACGCACHTRVHRALDRPHVPMRTPRTQSPPPPDCRSGWRMVEVLIAWESMTEVVKQTRHQNLQREKMKRL
jgi:hypothetical protein